MLQNYGKDSFVPSFATLHMISGKEKCYRDRVVLLLVAAAVDGEDVAVGVVGDGAYFEGAEP